MTHDRSNYFSRLDGRVDVAELTDAFVLVVGAGSVGSLLALELARCGVGHLLIADGDRLETHNLARHALPSAYVGTNKAEAMAEHLTRNVAGLDCGGIPHHLDDAFWDEQIDRLLMPAHLVIIATDTRVTQRRIAARALAMDVPAIVPGLFADRGGEVFVQLNPGEACFRCWDDFRDAGAEVRGASSINADAFGVIQQAVFLALGVLDPHSPHAREMAPPPGDQRPRQLFMVRAGTAPVRAPVTRRPECPGCAVGPSAIGEGPRSPEFADGLAREQNRRRSRRIAAGWPLLLDGDSSLPHIERVTVSAPVIVSGDEVTVGWQALNATHVEVDGGSPDPCPPAGELTVRLHATDAFRVRALNPWGETFAVSPTVRTIDLPRIREVTLMKFPEPPPAPGVFTQGSPVGSARARPGSDWLRRTPRGWV